MRFFRFQSMKSLFPWILVAGIAAVLLIMFGIQGQVLSANKPVRIFISVDTEGPSGIADWWAVYPKNFISFSVLPDRLSAKRNQNLRKTLQVLFPPIQERGLLTGIARQSTGKQECENYVVLSSRTREKFSAVSHAQGCVPCAWETAENIAWLKAHRG